VPPDAQKEGSSPTVEPSSAVIAPSSIVHRTSPQLQVRRPRELDPTQVDTGKDTQALVEEDKSEC
jgi:low density lipoprotein-related protein 2